MAKPKMSPKPIFVRVVTDAQYKWVKRQAEENLSSMTAVVRGLIQDKIDAEEKGEK